MDNNRRKFIFVSAVTAGCTAMGAGSGATFGWAVAAGGDKKNARESMPQEDRDKAYESSIKRGAGIGALLAGGLGAIAQFSEDETPVRESTQAPSP